MGGWNVIWIYWADKDTVSEAEMFLEMVFLLPKIKEGGSRHG